MTNNKDLFINIRPDRVTICLGDDSAINYYGRGTMALQARTTTGMRSPVLLEEVLYAPKLGQSNLLSWRKISTKEIFNLVGTETDLVIKKDGKNIVWGKLEVQDYVVQQLEDNARLLTSYDDWHHDFGHVSEAYIKPSCYTDGQLLMSSPKQFECSICKLSKSKKQHPPPATSHATRPFQLIHSNLSGKFST
jgi:hypothetical protein